MASRRLSTRIGRWVSQRLRWTREGAYYLVVVCFLLMTGLYQQINLIFLVAGLAFGPLIASLFVSSAMLSRLRVSRRLPTYMFSGEPLQVDFTLENPRRWTAALAMTVEDHVSPIDRTIPGATGMTPRVFFQRVPGQRKERIRWQGPTLKRGRYRFKTMELITRSPFGLFERRADVGDADELVVYPQVGQLTRRWYLLQREATETRRGQRHDRSTQQQEYHGLRDYRPGDSPRWIHWRTSARLGQPMVKEFEQQHEQDIAILLDPWQPRSQVMAEQREAMESIIRFAATVCLETCKHQGRRLILGWTGAAPGVRQGPASVKLLHELLEQLAILRPATEGSLAGLFDALPANVLREAVLVIVSTRPINLIEEVERSVRLAGTSSRPLHGRVVMFDASKGDLDDLVKFTDSVVATMPARRGVEDGVFDRIQPGGSHEIHISGTAEVESALAPVSAGAGSENGKERHR